MAPSSTPAGPGLSAGARIAEIDLLRGLVIVLMALDHVRDYFHISGYALNPLDPQQSYPLLYATRWITHFCAPTFVFLAGVSAWLQYSRGKGTPVLSRFLLTRGLWLIALEVTVVGLGWSFSFPYPLLLQVIWAIGWAMIALAALVWLPRMAVLILGIVIVVGHNLLDPLAPDQFGSAALVWRLLHEGGLVAVGGKPIGAAAYPILPWIGVIALGYGMGALWTQARPVAARNRTLIGLGLGMIVAFFVLRMLDVYGDSRHWAMQGDWVSTAMVFMNVTKYPPSLLYALITLGPMFVLLPWLARLQGVSRTVLTTFGAVPFLFYVLHIYLAHALGILANTLAGRDAGGMFGYMMNAFTSPEKLTGLGFPLPVVYVAWIAVLAILYPVCRRWAELKRTRRDWWLSYL